MYSEFFSILVLTLFVGNEGHKIIDGDSSSQKDIGQPLNNDTVRKLYFEERKPILVENEPVFLTTLPLVKLGDNYYYFSNETVNFYKAFEFCKENHMELASIESQTENDLIIRHLHERSSNRRGGRDSWLSGNDLGKEGEFIWWSTGQPVTYTNWHFEEPNNEASMEHCMHIRELWRGDGCYLGWNDNTCDSIMSFICETQPMYEFSLKKQVSEPSKALAP